MHSQYGAFGVYAVLAALLGVSAYTDARWGKVKNFVTGPALLLGFAAHGIFGGTQGLLLSLEGVGLAVGLFLLLGLLGRVMGGGDAKLLIAVGALVGPVILIWVVAYGALAGGVIALGYSLATGRLKQEVTGLLMSIAWLFTRTSKLDYSHSDSQRIPYAIPLALGTILAIASRGGVILV